jgi:hypothetical protein
MPDPISSSSVPSSASDVMCTYGDDPALMSQGPTPSIPATQTTTPRACELPTASAEPADSSASSDLVQKFSNNDHSALIAAAPSISAPSGPPPLTVRPDQLDVQTGVPRFESRATVGALHLTGGLDVFNANAHLGSLNEDGSHGENIGAGANLANGELTLDYKGWSLSVGVGLSLGGSIASGEGRDLDADGVPERCFKMSLGNFTLGECDEL